MSAIKLSTPSSGSISLSPADTASNLTITVPAVTGTMLTTASTFAGTGPAFSATNSGSQTVSAAVDTKVTLDTEVFDTNSNFASSRFTPTVAGYYQINGGVYCPSVTRTIAMLYKNGVIFSFGTDYVTSLGEQRSRASTMVYLNGTTDYVELYVLPFGGTSVGSGISNTFLSGSLVRAA